MKRFIVHFFIWIVVVAVLAAAMDYVISAGLRKTDIRKYAVWNDIYAKRIDSDIVIMGSSRAWCMYNTYIIDSILGVDSYNIGIDGHGFDFQEIRYKTYRRFCRKPKVILLNVDFLSTLYNSSEGYEREQFFPYIYDNELISEVKENKKITVFDRFVPLYRYFGYREDIEKGIASFCGKKIFEDAGMHKGYRGNEYNWNPESLLLDTIFEATIDSNIIYQLEEFVKEAQGEGIKVIMVKSPVYKPLFKKFTNIENTDSIFMSISKRNNIPLLDYYDVYYADDSTFYYNPSHLNKKGSELFTTNLCKDLATILNDL